MHGPVPVHVQDNCQTPHAHRPRLPYHAETGQPLGFSGDGGGGLPVPLTLPKAPSAIFSEPQKTPVPATRATPFKTGVILAVFPLNHPALRGSLISSIQTALYWPVFLIVKCSISPTGVTLCFHEKHWPENPWNRPVGCP